MVNVYITRCRKVTRQRNGKIRTLGQDHERQRAIHQSFCIKTTEQNVSMYVETIMSNIGF